MRWHSMARAVALLTVAAATPLKVTLSRRPGGFNVSESNENFATLAWHASMHRWFPLLAEEPTPKEHLKNFQNMLYTGKLLLGTPPQEVQLVFDTGSSDLWAMSDTFDAIESSTWEPTDYHVTLQYGKGAAAGYYGLDTACLDSSPALCVKRQPVLLADRIAEIDPNKMDGILGLGFIGISHVHRTFLRNLNESFEDLSFAFDLTASSTSSVVFGNHAEVMEEGFRATGISQDQVVHSKVVDLFRIPDLSQPQAGWWLLHINAKVLGHGDLRDLLSVRYSYFLLYTQPFFLGCFCTLVGTLGFSYCKGRGAVCNFFLSTLWCWCSMMGILLMFSFLYYCLTLGAFDQKVYAALDTGSSLISMPPEDFYRVALAIWDVHFFWDCTVQSGTLICLCEIADKGRPLSLSFQGKEIHLRSEEMMTKVGYSDDGSAVCLAGIAYNVQPIWILGDVFLRQAFVVHDFARQEVNIFPRRPVEPKDLDLMEGSSLTGLAGVVVLAALVAGLAAALVLTVPQTRVRVAMPAVDQEAYCRLSGD